MLIRVNTIFQKLPVFFRVKFGGEAHLQRWKPIFVALTEGNRRFNEMQRLIDGISAKGLSTELKELELNGFVRRKEVTYIPVVVESKLTENAETRSKVLQALGEWGAKHKEMVKKKYAYEESCSCLSRIFW